MVILEVLVGKNGPTVLLITTYEARAKTDAAP
jgi:hypothetical protein